MKNKHQVPWTPSRSHGPRWRPSKTRQTRIKFRHTPRVFDPTEYLRDLRDPPDLEEVEVPGGRVSVVTKTPL